MSIIQFSDISIKGVSATTPAETCETLDCPILTPSEARTIVKHFGVKRIHKSIEHSTFDLCHHAAARLLDGLHWAPGEVDLLISVTQTPDHLMPSNASQYQESLQLREDCILFEVNTGCSGYVQALMIAASMLQNTAFEKALVLSGETTYNVSTHDKSTRPFMGDAGTATAISYNNGNDGIIFNTHMDGSKASAIQIPSGGAASYKNTVPPSGFTGQELKVEMNGEAVKDYIFYKALPTIRELNDWCHSNDKHIDHYIFHQVNKIVLSGMAKKLMIDQSIMLNSFEDYGNTSSASIPLSMCRNNEQLNGSGCTVFLSGFGVGMSNINAVVSMDKALIQNISHI